jgi:phosphonate transport system permease protein
MFSSFYKSLKLILVAIIVIAVYTLGFKTTEFNLRTLITGIPNGMVLVQDFFTPDVIIRETIDGHIEFDFPVPCGSTAEVQIKDQGPRIMPSVSCADVGSNIIIEGIELQEGATVVLYWILQSQPEMRLRAAKITADSVGNFQTEIEVRPLVATKDGQDSKLRAEISHEVGTIKLSPALLETVDAAVETLLMALIATSLAAFFAAPISFLAAANIMKGNLLGKGIYNISRLFLNITRTFEPLVLATIFGLWVGFGPFAGVLALTLITIASLGKMFSELIENIDDRPVEAILATGGSTLEIVRYAIIPQVIPNFTSLVIYHWDINVRISTIVGFVGGGGIGHLLNQNLQSFAYHKAGTVIWIIILMVWLLDFLSAKIREQVI